jgi:hypothetical protein
MGMLTMQDIAGCRAIVGSVKQIRNIVQEFEKDSSFEIINFDDYIDNPRETGYSSFHLIVRPVNSDRVVEIQLRTRKHHYWATFVEITDLLYGIKLKEGQEHPDLFNFHKILSKEKENITLEDKSTLNSIERKLDIISKISSLFNSNYLSALKRWIESQPEKDSKYLIMELDDKLSPSFTFYRSFIEAENDYFIKFTKTEPNMVLIHIDNVDIDKLELAYSNYLLTSHPAVKFYLELLGELILDLRSEKNDDDFLNLYKYYDSTINTLISNFNNEVQFVSDYIKEAKLTNSNSQKMVQAWYNNLVSRAKEFQKDHTVLHKKINETSNSSKIIDSKKGWLNRFLKNFSLTS